MFNPGVNSLSYYRARNSGEFSKPTAVNFLIYAHFLNSVNYRFSNGKKMGLEKIAKSFDRIKF